MLDNQRVFLRGEIYLHIWGESSIFASRFMNCDARFDVIIRTFGRGSDGNNDK